MVWGFEASFTTDLPSAGSGQMCYLGPSRFPADFGVDRPRPRWGLCSPAGSIPHIGGLGWRDTLGWVSNGFCLLLQSGEGEWSTRGRRSSYLAHPSFILNIFPASATIKDFIPSGWGVRGTKKVSYCASLGQSDRKSWKAVLGAQERKRHKGTP